MGSKSQDKARRRARRKEKRTHSGRDADVIPLFGTPRIPYVDQFGDWVTNTIFDGNSGPTNDLLEQLEILLSAIRQAHPDFDPTAWTTADIDAMVSFLEFAQSRELVPSEQARAIALAAQGYLSFLEEHGLWGGTDGVADYSRSELLSAVGLEQSGLMIGDIDEEDERAALLATQPVARLIELVAWIGDERPVTQSRWLKPALLPQLAAALSVDLPPQARSMSSFPPLRDIWEHAQIVAVIDVNTVRAAPGTAAVLWHADAPIEILRLGLTTWISLRFSELADNPELVDAFTGVIVGGMGNLPAGRHHIETWPDQHGMSRSVVHDLLRLLEDAVDAGWVNVVDDEFVIPEALRAAVAMALPGPPGRGDIDIDDAEPALLTVRVTLDGTEPPVWRRIELDSETSLDELHAILQAAFDWEDSHLHQFSSAGCTFVPDQQLPDCVGCAHPEGDFVLGDLLVIPGASLVYEYDFGDGWRHTITLETTSPPGTAEPAHITDGAGMAPLEDVGGPGGWLEFIDAVNDPAHPRNAELRLWAGLDTATPVDPDAFDRQATNRGLQRLGL
ncbi:MAG: plasmid pRiA4b ORF-3 family protein [Gordonia amarae]